MRVFGGGFHPPGQQLCTLLVWAATVGMGDLTLAVLKLQLLFISSPPPSPLFISVLGYFSSPLSSASLSSSLAGSQFITFLPLLTPFSSCPFTSSLLLFFPSQLLLSPLLSSPPNFLINLSSSPLLRYAFCAPKLTKLTCYIPTHTRINTPGCTYIHPHKHSGPLRVASHLLN